MNKYAAFDHLIEGAQIIDSNWRYVYVNDVVANHGRAPKNTYIGCTMMEKYPGIEHTEMFAQLRKCMENKVPAQLINHFEYPDGSSGWFELSMQPVEEGVLILSFDITQLKETEAKLDIKLAERSRMLTQLTEQKKQLEDFCHIIAHNIRAPLANLLLLNDMMTSALDTADIKMLVGKQKPVVEFLHETFEELVDIIQVRTDYSVTVDVVDLGEMAHHVTDLLQGEILQTGTQLSVDFSKAPLAKFPRKYMESIMFNLLSNAIKYRSPQRVPQVEIRSYTDGGWLHLEVQDNGLGIDLQKYGHKLFKLRKTFHQHPNAKGLGLFMTRNQIEAMGGSVSVNSTEGEGSTFIVKLNNVE
ncbi:MAG: ATP-binding protein [Bacteroidia bacterium]